MRKTKKKINIEMVLLRGRGMMFKEFENGIFSLPSHDYFEQLE